MISIATLKAGRKSIVFFASENTEHEEGEACFVFDIGDYVDRSHPFTEGTYGKGNTHLLNAAGYDAVTIGNNEGITMAKDALSTLYTEADFDVILCNLFENGKYPEWAVPFKVYTTAMGTKIGVIGATAEYPSFYAKLGWKVTEPREAVKKYVEQLKGDMDILVCLSHMGIHEDERLAANVRKLDVIFGAHTHHLFHEGEFVGPVLLAATGKYGDYIGQVTLQIDRYTKEVTGKNAMLFRTEQLERTESDIEEVKGYMDCRQTCVGGKSVPQSGTIAAKLVWGKCHCPPFLAGHLRPIQMQIAHSSMRGFFLEVLTKAG